MTGEGGSVTSGGVWVVAGGATGWTMAARAKAEKTCMARRSFDGRDVEHPRKVARKNSLGFAVGISRSAHCGHGAR